MEQHADALFPQTSKRKQQTKRVVRNGAATNSLVLSAYAEGNDQVFPRILDLYVKPGSVTYGKGVFWRTIPVDRYDLRTTDIQDGVDCRNLPIEELVSWVNAVLLGRE